MHHWSASSNKLEQRATLWCRHCTRPYHCSPDICTHNIKHLPSRPLRLLTPVASEWPSSSTSSSSGNQRLDPVLSLATLQLNLETWLSRFLSFSPGERIKARLDFTFFAPQSQVTWIGMGCRGHVWGEGTGSVPAVWSLSCWTLVCGLVTAAVKCPLQTWSNPPPQPQQQEMELNTQSYNGIAEAGHWTSVCSFSEYKLAQ